jgi:hypothetical protein
MISFLYKKFKSLLIKEKLKGNINLGGDERFSKDYSCVGLTSHFKLDITKNLPPLFKDNSIDFIWSERMLEHIKSEDLVTAFLNIKKLLKKNSTARFCLPSCFYNNDISIDCMRAGNAEKQKKLGHVTFFTYEGFGPILDHHFGTNSPPEPTVYYEEIFKILNFKFELIRYHNKNKQIIFNNNFLSSEYTNKFKDRTEILIKRPNSLIFDLTKI